MMSDQPPSLHNGTLRDLPSVAALADAQELRHAAERYGQPVVTAAIREAVGQLREALQTGRHVGPLPPHAELAKQISQLLAAQEFSALRPVVNATGILLHTGLGRAPLAQEAAEAAEQAARNYCSIELDLVSGERTGRTQVVERLLRELTGAEAAHVVNNNAGATGLILAALAKDSEVIVSHGELIEIGGGYRLPDVITAYGAILRPVGTTNKTRLEDYANALGDETGAMLVVHPSNYHISGFTEQPELKELTTLARTRQVPLVHDIGSGALIDFAQFGCEQEPIAAQSIQAGADLVLFSGDKLLGGPQCGIIVGRRELVELVAKHPLSRALRVDKITLAALHATLKLYRRPQDALQSIPLLRFLNTPSDYLRCRTEQLAEQLSSNLSAWDVQANRDEAFVGGGSLPQQAIPSWCITLSSSEHDVAELAQRLRMGTPAIMGRVQHQQLILCLHGLFPDQDEQLSQAVLSAAEAMKLSSS